VREADDLTTFMCRMSWNFGSLSILEPSGPHRACYGTALPLPFTVHRGWHSRFEPCIFWIPRRNVDQSTALSPLCYLTILRMTDIIQQEWWMNQEEWWNGIYQGKIEVFGKSVLVPLSSSRILHRSRWWESDKENPGEMVRPAGRHLHIPRSWNIVIKYDSITK